MVHRAHAQLPHRAVSGGPHRDPPGPRAPPALGRAGAARLGGEDREGRRVAPDDPPREDTHRSPRVLATPRPGPRDVDHADPSSWAPGATRVALVHDWLTGMRGGERCLEVFCELFPEAPLFTLLHVPGSVSPVIERRRVITSFIQRLPGAVSRYRQYLPLFPAAVRGFDLSGFDLVISLSHSVAKAVRRPADALHICYCFSPM